MAPSDVDTVMASGTIDATEVAVSFRMPGILQRRPVDEGSLVRMGQVLAELDPREMTARVHRARAAEQAALARLKDLERGYRPEEIAEARAQVELARASRDIPRGGSRPFRGLVRDWGAEPATAGQGCDGGHRGP